MTRSTALFIALIGILTVAVAAPFAMVAWNDYKFRKGVDACVATFGYAQPAADALIDLQHGDEQFGQLTQGGITHIQYIPGLKSNDSRDRWRCYPNEKSGSNKTSSRISIWKRRSEDWLSDPRGGGEIKPLTLCGRLYKDYVFHYNLEKAELSPISAKRYANCSVLE